MLDKKVYMMLVEPDKKPTIIQAEANEIGLASYLSGTLESIFVPEDNIIIFFDRNGVSQDKPLNRVVKLTQNKEIDLTYEELRSKFREAESEGKHIKGYITFTEDSFYQPYPLDSRTYVVGSNNKAFQSNMGGYSIYGSSIDGTDVGVRLERYMRAEHGGENGWEIEQCFVKENELICDQIVGGNMLICSFWNDNKELVDISQDMVDKYSAMFRNIPEFHRNSNNEIAVIESNTTPEKDFDR